MIEEAMMGCDLFSFVWDINVVPALLIVKRQAGGREKRGFTRLPAVKQASSAPQIDVRQKVARYV